MKRHRRRQTLWLLATIPFVLVIVVVAAWAVDATIHERQVQRNVSLGDRDHHAETIHLRDLDNSHTRRWCGGLKFYDLHDPVDGRLRNCRCRPVLGPHGHGRSGVIGGRGSAFEAGQIDGDRRVRCLDVRCERVG